MLAFSVPKYCASVSEYLKFSFEGNILIQSLVFRHLLDDVYKEIHKHRTKMWRVTGSIPDIAT